MFAICERTRRVRSAVRRRDARAQLHQVENVARQQRHAIDGVRAISWPTVELVASTRDVDSFTVTTSFTLPTFSDRFTVVAWSTETLMLFATSRVETRSGCRCHLGIRPEPATRTNTSPASVDTVDELRPRSRLSASHFRPGDDGPLIGHKSADRRLCPPGRKQRRSWRTERHAQEQSDERETDRARWNFLYSRVSNLSY